MVKTLLVLHLFGVIIWLGNLLSLTTLLRMATQDGDAGKSGLANLVQRTLIAAASVGAGVTIVFGLGLIISEPAVLYKGWLHAKILLVIALLVLHVRFYRRVHALSGGSSNITAKDFAFLHGLMSLFVLIILFLAVLKPF